MAAGLSTGIALSVSASLLWQWRRGACAAAGEWRLTDEGSCTGPCITDDARSRRYRVMQAHRCPGCVRLLLEDANRRRRVLLIARDAVEPEVFRELCARIVQHRLPVRDQRVHQMPV